MGIYDHSIKLTFDVFQWIKSPQKSVKQWTIDI